jgi:hypothetical protein
MDAADSLDETGLEYDQLRFGAGRPGELARIREVEAEAGRGRQDLAGPRVAEAAPGAAERIRRELRVGVDVGLGAGPAGLVVDDDGRAVGRAVDAVDVADEADRDGPVGNVERQRHVDAEAELDADGLGPGGRLALEELLEDRDRPAPGLLGLAFG